MKFLQGLVATVLLLLSTTNSWGSRPDSAHPHVHAAGQITIVTHVDIGPPNLPRALVLFHNYLNSSRHASGNVSMQLLRQSNHDNHFTLIEVWSSRAAYDEHISSVATRDFHQQIDPLLGSPHDERLFVQE